MDDIADLSAQLSMLEGRLSTVETNSKQKVSQPNSGQANTLSFPLDPITKKAIQQLIGPTRVQLTDASAINTDCTLGNDFYVILHGNRTLNNPTGAKAGQRIVFELIQDSTGSRTITLGSLFVVGGFTVTLSTTANARDYLDVIYSDSDNLFYVIDFIKSTGVTVVGGSNTQVQFNDSGTLAGDSGMTYNKTTNSLTLGGTVSATEVTAGSGLISGVLQVQGKFQLPVGTNLYP